MANTLPKISFQSGKAMGIEVMTFAETYDKFQKVHDHDPFSPHKIQFYLILVVTDKTYTHYVDFDLYTLKKGSVLFVAKNQVHHFTESFKKAKGFSFVLNSTYFEQNYFSSKNIRLSRLYNYHLESPSIHQQDMAGDSFIGIANKLYNEYNFPNTFAKQEMLQALLQVLLLKAERAKEVHSENGPTIHWIEIFNSFKNMLEVDYVNSRSSRYYASKLYISYKLLNDVVKQLTSKTVKAFIDDFVVIEIKRYLVSTALSVKEISYKTGFDEPANMIKFFKKNTDSTPLRFRKNL